MVPQRLTLIYGSILLMVVLAVLCQDGLARLSGLRTAGSANGRDGCTAEKDFGWRVMRLLVKDLRLI